MEEAGGLPPRRPVIRLCGSVAKGRESSARSANLGGRTPGHPNANPVALKPVTEGLLTAVDCAVQQLGSEEIAAGMTAQEILSDDSARASAAKWRSGTMSRRITATLARLVSSLQSWSPNAARSAPPAAAMEAGRPKPLRGGPETSTSSRPTVSSSWASS